MDTIFRTGIFPGNVLFLLFAALTASKAQGQSPSPDWVKLAPKTAIELSARENFTTVWIPLEIDEKVDFSTVKVADHPEMLRYGGRYDTSFADGVTVHKDTSTLYRVRLQVDLKRLVLPGVYEGTLVFKRPVGNTWAMRRVDFSLRRPSARIEPPAAINILIEGSTIRKADPLSFRELDGLSKVHTLELVSPDFASVKRPGAIEFAAPAVTLPAGIKTQIGYNLYDQAWKELPLGETKGKMFVSAAEMAPVSIDFTIVNKRDRMWIAVCILAGALTGLLVRTYLLPAKALAEARVEGYEAIETVNLKIRNLTDPKVKEALRNATLVLTEELVRSEHSTRPGLKEAIRASAAKLIEDVNQLLKNHDGRKDELRQDVENLARLFEYSPVYLDVTIYTRAREAFRAAAGLLGDSNVSEGRDKLTESMTILKKLVGDVYAGGKTFVSAIDSIYPDFVQAQAKRDFMQLYSGLQEKVKVTVDLSTIERLQALFLGANEIYDNINTLVKQLMKIVQEQGADDAEFNAQRKAWELLLEENVRALFNNAGLSIALQRAKAEMEKRWEVLHADQAAPESYTTTNDTTGITFQAGGTLPPHETFPITPEKEVSLAGQARKRYWILATGQLVLVLVLMCIAAYGAYAPDFIGKTEEMIAIFIFAFGLDITLDNLKLITGKS